MSIPNYPRFLSECFTQDPLSQSGIPDDQMYGVYVSWCLLNGETPGSSESLWAAMSQQGHARQHVSGDRHVWTGLTMKGPAAVDYILSSQPSLL